MIENDTTAEMVQFLQETETVEDWGLAEFFAGFVLKSPSAFDPDLLPDGWRVGSISGDTIHIRPTN